MGDEIDPNLGTGSRRKLYISPSPPFISPNFLKSFQAPPSPGSFSPDRFFHHNLLKKVAPTYSVLFSQARFMWRARPSDVYIYITTGGEKIKARKEFLPGVGKGEGSLGIDLRKKSSGIWVRPPPPRRGKSGGFFFLGMGMRVCVPGCGRGRGLY